MIGPCLQCVVMLSQDSFYRGLSPEELADVACEPAVIHIGAKGWVRCRVIQGSFRSSELGTAKATLNYPAPHPALGTRCEI